MEHAVFTSIGYHNNALMRPIYQQMKKHEFFKNVRMNEQKLEGVSIIKSISFNYTPNNKRYKYINDPLDNPVYSAIWDEEKGKVVAEFGAYHPLTSNRPRFFPKVKSIRQILDALKEV